ncbi:MAG: CTB family bacteriocin [Aulosira sp. DedQUE10]|nr:CTB family bacteriocin [Aulosira sp. DedQUE10]
MSDNKPMELSAEELDIVAGGAVSVVDATNLNAIDEQASATLVPGSGGITSLNSQKTAVSQQQLKEIKFTGESLPGLPDGFFSAS